MNLRQDFKMGKQALIEQRWMFDKVLTKVRENRNVLLSTFPHQFWVTLFFNFSPSYLSINLYIYLST